MRTTSLVGIVLSSVVLWSANASGTEEVEDEQAQEQMVAEVDSTDQESPDEDQLAQDEVAGEVEEETDAAQDLSEYVEEQLLEPVQSFPYVEFHGYFRFRGDNFWNLDLDTRGTSPVLPPLEATLTEDDNVTPERDAERISGANIRFRLHPIFHITDKARIHAEFDLLDNISLGTTPDGFSSARGINYRYDTPLVAFTPGAQPPNEDSTFRDAFRIRSAYAEMEFFGLLRVGRMPSNWGLGILANSGGAYSATPMTDRYSMNRNVQLQGWSCMDCDYGDLADRIMFITRVFPTLYVGLSYDWPSQGSYGYFEDQPFGQARDLAEIDDVFQMVFTAFRSYFTERERRERTYMLTQEHRPVVEGGAYFVLRKQTAEQGAGGFYPNDTESAFYPRMADAYIPDIWVRMLYEPRHDRQIRLELEAVGMFGSVENVLAGIPDQDHPETASRNLQEFGLAFESDFRFGPVIFGLNSGYASGRSTEGDKAANAPGWGVLDLNPVTAGDDSDLDVTNFKFDRDYIIDMIMFREIIGTVTNAVYFDPFVQYNFFNTQDSVLGARLDFLYAFAPKPDPTPGGERSIGFETEVNLFFRSASMLADVAYGLFVPFGAFDGVEERARIPEVANFWGIDQSYVNNVDATLAHTLQFRLMWAF